MQAPPQLEATSLSYTYADGTKALQDISFQIKKGEKIALLGANGSGKSTLFLSLMGLLKPKTGYLRYNGQAFDYSKKGLLSLRSEIGIVFQEPDHQLFLSDVYGELSFGLFNLGYSKEVVKSKVDSIIEQIPISDFVYKSTQFLSGGQKKLVTIGDVLVMEPKVILLDEPTASLDPLHTQIIHNLIDSFTERGITIILSTHLVSHAYGWADRVLLLEKGNIIAEGSPDFIFTRTDLLKQAHLHQPEVLRIYLTMKNLGMLKNHYTLPKKITDLEQILEEEVRRDHESHISSQLRN